MEFTLLQIAQMSSALDSPLGRFPFSSGELLLSYSDTVFDCRSSAPRKGLVLSLTSRMFRCHDYLFLGLPLCLSPDFSWSPWAIYTHAQLCQPCEKTARSKSHDPVVRTESLTRVPG